MAALTVEDRLEIIELTNLLLLYGDTHQWDKIEALFTNPLVLDYTELLGGEPKTITPQEQSKAWHHELGGLDKSFHLLTNHVVEPDGDGARCTANLHATHVLENLEGDDSYVVAGRYVFKLVRSKAGWLISEQKLSLIYATGNPAILKLGEARIESRAASTDSRRR